MGIWGDAGSRTSTSVQHNLCRTKNPWFLLHGSQSHICHKTSLWGGTGRVFNGRGRRRSVITTIGDSEEANERGCGVLRLGFNSVLLRYVLSVTNNEEVSSVDTPPGRHGTRSNGVTVFPPERRVLGCYSILFQFFVRFVRFKRQTCNVIAGKAVLYPCTN